MFGVHGVGGFLGTILCGIFAAEMFGGNQNSAESYTILGSVWTQLVGASSAAIYTIIATIVIPKLTQLLVGLRVDATTENRGLDLTEHEERGYILH